jgi:hypothetical protein
MTASLFSYALLQLRGNPFTPFAPKSGYEDFRPLFSARLVEVQRVCRFAINPRAIFVVAPFGGGKTVVLLESLEHLKSEGFVVVYSTFRREKGFCPSLAGDMASAGISPNVAGHDALNEILASVRRHRQNGRSIVLAVDDLDRATDLSEISRVTHEIRDILAEGAAVVVTGQPFGVTYDLNTSAGGLFQKVDIPEFKREDFREMLVKYLGSVHASSNLLPTHPFEERAASFICDEVADAKLTPRLFNFAVAQLLDMALSAERTDITFQDVLSFWPRVADGVVRGLTDLQRQHLGMIFEEKDLSEDSDSVISALGESPLAEFPEVQEKVLRPLVEKNLVQVQNVSGKEHFRLTPHAATSFSGLRGPLPADARKLLLGLWQGCLAATGGDQKGKSLERFLAEFLRQVPGFVVPKDGVRLRTETEELDVVVEVGYEHHSMYGILTICECKNWSTAVDGPELAHLEDKLRERSARFGIFVAANGVTPGFRAKMRSYLQAGLVIALLTRDDFARLEGEDDPAMILRESYYRTVKYIGEAS